jgi:hypothetical protein
MTHPEDCRANAARCIEMANEATGNVLLQNMLYDIAENWLKAADLLELEVDITLNGASQAPASYH